MVADIPVADLATEALSCARYNEEEELVRLLDANPQVLLRELRDANGNSPLHMASANGHVGKCDEGRKKANARLSRQLDKHSNI